jgi:hypothetical protein
MEDDLMFKRIAVLAATVSVVAVMGSVMAGAAFAQGPAPDQAPLGLGRVDGAGMGFGAAGGPAWAGQACLDAASKVTGLSEAEIQAQRVEGKSLAQIAQAKGITEDKLMSELLAAKKAVLDNLVKAGVLTQAQADLMFANMTEQVKVAVERTSVGPAASTSMGPGKGACLSDGTVFPAPAAGAGRGAMRGFGRSQNSAAPRTGN